MNNCYAFIEAGLRDLADDGKLAYLIPYSVIRNKHAEKVRMLIKELYMQNKLHTRTSDQNR